MMQYTILDVTTCSMIIGESIKDLFNKLDYKHHEELKQKNLIDNFSQKCY